MIMPIRLSLKTSLKTAVLGAVLALAGNAAMAADVMTQVQNFGTLSAPYSTFYGHTFTAATRPNAADTFYDDYAFTVDAGAFSSISATFDLGSLLQISNLTARLFTGTPWTGSTPGTLNSADLLQRWSTTVASGTGSGSVQSISPIALGAATAGCLTLRRCLNPPASRWPSPAWASWAWWHAAATAELPPSPQRGEGANAVAVEKLSRAHFSAGTAFSFNAASRSFSASA